MPRRAGRGEAGGVRHWLADRTTAELVIVVTAGLLAFTALWMVVNP